MDRIAELPAGIAWRSTVHRLVSVAAALHDHERAERLYQLLLPSAARMDWFGGGLRAVRLDARSAHGARR